MAYPISDVPRRIVYSGSAGVGPYAFTFEVLANTDIAVYKNTTLLTLTTDYTVTINTGTGTGTVTLVVAATGADTVTIVGDRAIQRTSDFVTGGDLFASTLNDELDSLTIAAQQVNEKADRAIRARVTDPTTLDMTLPAYGTRANKLMGFAANGAPTLSTSTIAELEAAIGSFVSGTGNNAATVIYTPAGTGAAVTTVQSKLRETVSVKDFGAVGDGVTDDTTAIQNALNSGAKVILFPAGNYIFTTLTIPLRVTLEGEGADVTYLKTATSGNALLLNGERITLKQFTLQQTSGSRQGKGVVGSDRYWLITECVKVLGFDYGLYCDKALYHSHKQSWFEDGNYGVYYWGASGSWNIDWFNNVVTFDTCRFNGNTNIGTYVKGTEIVFINPDWSGMVNTNSIGLKVVGEAANQPAHGIKVITPYAEVTDIVFSFLYAYVEIDGGFVQGGTASGSAAATSIIDADNSTVYWKGRPRDQDYWDFGYRLTNSSRLTFDRTFSGSIRASNTVDGTSAVVTMATVDLITGDFTATGTIKASATDGILYAQATTGSAVVTLESNARYWRWITSNGDSTLRLRDETSGLERLRCDTGGNFIITGGGGLGYGAGSGGTVTQTTSRTTGVTINKTTGEIQLVSAAGSTSWTSFTVSNTTINANDTVVVSQKSGTNLYQIFVTSVIAGTSFRVTFATTGGTTVEQPVFQFAVIRGAIT